MSAGSALDQVHPLVRRILRPHLPQVIEPVHRVLRSIGATDEMLVEDVQGQEVVDRPELSVAFGGSGPRRTALIAVRSSVGRVAH